MPLKVGMLGSTVAVVFPFDKAQKTSSQLNMYWLNDSQDGSASITTSASKG